MAGRAPTRVLEKVEQAGIVQLWRSLGGRVWVIGTRRRRGDYQGTMQTPGTPDLHGFLPAPRYNLSVLRPTMLYVECKAHGGRLSKDQAEFRDWCLAAGVAHVCGGVDAFIAFLIAGGWMRADQVAHYRLGVGAIGSSADLSITGARGRRISLDSDRP